MTPNPDAASDARAAHWRLRAEHHPDLIEALQAAPKAVNEAARTVLFASDFVATTLQQDATLLRAVTHEGFIETGRVAEPPAVNQQSTGPISTVPVDEAAFMAALRAWRNRELVRIAWRDLAGMDTLGATLAQLSTLADLAVRAAHDFSWQAQCARYGEPRSETGAAQSLIVVGMGKLGGGELNFSSDIDLILLFPEAGVTSGAHSIDNVDFFTRMGQQLIKLLDTHTQNGFVFRVDMRLRPFGDSGPLVASAASLEDYLQLHGRDWERYAWVKARALTGIPEYAELYRNAVRPFVYRRYLDFGVFEALREMKGLIEREVVRRDLADNIKLGPGGIREIEFVVQAFQLVRGGQDMRLQKQALLEVLPRLAGMRLLPPVACEELSGAYIFLRRLENRLQMLDDAQTHELPLDPFVRQRIAFAMGMPDWDALLVQLAEHRARVAAHFKSVVFAQVDPEAMPAHGLLGGWPEPDTDPEQLRATLAALGYADAQADARLLHGVASSALMKRLDEVGRRRLTALVPVLVSDASAAREPGVVLRRLLRILESIGARSAYFALLLEHGGARGRLIEIAAHGDFLTDQIASHPLLLDELLDEQTLGVLPTRQQLAEDLAQRLAHVDADDEERQVEQLRHFQRAALFRIAVADLSGKLPVMRASDRLTEVAELILEQALRLNREFLTQRLGVPMCGTDAERREVRICAVGYGKLGGHELGYSSDLDLVFLHDSKGEQQETSGPRPIENQVFFVRYVQRLVHLLTMQSRAGRLYEVDMRLRPSGKGGMLITHLDAFQNYQRTEAWTWEHQALLHARAVAGDPGLRERFEAVRDQVLRENVRRDTLREEVRKMRQRMRDELSKAKDGEFDLKQDPGGIADIEFLAQYWALRWAAEYPPVALFSDTIRQLESVASADLVPQERIDILTAAYRAYRAFQHHRALDGMGPVVAASEFVAERHAVVALWEEAMAV